MYFKAVWNLGRWIEIYEQPKAGENFVLVQWPTCEKFSAHNTLHMLNLQVSVSLIYYVFQF